jgi:glycosyltransferase involved in cell wall biosynthesis
MRVLYVISDFNNENGGKSHAVLAYLRSIRCKVETIEIICSRIDSYFLNEIAASLKIDQKRVNIISLRYFMSLSNIIHFLKIIRDRRVKFHFHGVFDVLSLVLMRICPSGFVVSPHGMLNNYGMKNSSKKRLFYRFYLKYLLNRSSALIFTSSEERRQTLSNISYDKNTFIVPIPLGAQLYQARTKAHAQLSDARVDTEGSPALHVGTIGRIHPVKNIENLLRAISLDSRFMLSIGGHGEFGYFMTLKKLADDLGVSDQVKWLGLLNEKSKYELLQNLDVYVQASWSESFGLAAVEAAGVGVPVVCSEGVSVARELSSLGVCEICSPTSHGLHAALSKFLKLKIQGRIHIFSSQAKVRQKFCSMTIGCVLTNVYECASCKSHSWVD